MCLTGKCNACCLYAAYKKHEEQLRKNYFVELKGADPKMKLKIDVQFVINGQPIIGTIYRPNHRTDVCREELRANQALDDLS